MADTNPAFNEEVENLVVLQGEILKSIAEKVAPWGRHIPLPMPVEIENTTPQSLHAFIRIEQGILKMTFKPRVRDPEYGTTVIAPGASERIDPNQRPSQRRS